MSIDAVCPECLSRFRLDEAMLAKSMRCPTCKFVFEVKESSSGPVNSSRPTRSRTDPPKPNFASGNVGDLVPLLTSPPTAKATEEPVVMTWSDHLEPPSGETKSRTVIPQIEEAGPVVTTWHDSVEVPTPAATTDFAGDDPTPPGRTGRKVLLAGMVTFIVAALAAGGYFAKKYIDQAPERLNIAADAEYASGRFDQARKLFDQLAKEHPESPHAAKARFFTELCATRGSVGSVRTRDEPKEAVELWRKFIVSLDDEALAPFAAKDRYGLDIWQTGVKLTEDVLAKGNDVAGKGDFADAERWLTESATIEGSLERFRPPDAPKPESVANDVRELRAKITRGRDRLAALDELKILLGPDPGDDTLARARQFAAEKGFANDDGFQGVIRESEKKLESKATYAKVDPPTPSTQLPGDGHRSLLIASQLDRGGRRMVSGLPGIFFAVARGVLYALDEIDGRLVWAARIGPDGSSAFVVVPASDQHPELILLPTGDGRQAGLQARGTRDGRLLWYQPLPQVAIGSPAVVGSHVYVPLADPQGTLVEILLGTGDITGQIKLGRPIGIGAAARPGTGHLYIAAESRAIAVFDCDKRGPNGERLEPSFLGVMNVGHPPGGLRNRIGFTNAEPDAPGPKHLVLSVADGLGSMRLKAYPLTTADGKPENVAATVDLPLAGWASFAPKGDSERLALTTDAGTIGLYGLNQEGNRDSPLFDQSKAASTGGSQPESPSQVVRLDEGALWVVTAGQLRLFRLGFNANSGSRIVPYSKTLSVGDPIQDAQITPGGDAAFLVVKVGSTIRGVMVDLQSLKVQWQRELGVTVKGEPVRQGTAAIVLDPGGAIFRIDPTTLPTESASGWQTDERWMLAPPLEAHTALTPLLPIRSDAHFTILEHKTDAGHDLVFRFIEAGVVREVKCLVNAGLAGMPVVQGGMLIVPLANGSLYRLAIADGKALQEGPSWRSDRLGPTAVCQLATLNPDEFVSTDGSKLLLKWQWPNGSNIFETRGRLTLPEKLRYPPQFLGDSLGLLLTDINGNLTLWDSRRFAPPATRIWRNGEKGPLPSGSLSYEPFVVRMADGATRIVVVVGNRVAVIAPESVELKAIGDADPVAVSGPPRPLRPGVVGVPRQDGSAWVIDLANGTIQKTESRSVPEGNGISLDDEAKLRLVPQPDGTLLIVPVDLPK